MAVAVLPYHVGVVVSDLDAATAQLTRLIGFTWRDVQQASMRVDSGTAVVAADISFVFSREGTPHLELIAMAEGTPWETPGLHHLGFWTDDAVRASPCFDEGGMPRESVCVDDNGAWVAGLYHRNSDGLRIELNEIGRSGPKLLRYLAGNHDFA